MKKILFAMVAVAAICFTSCGNKTQQGEAVDSVALIDSLSEEAVQGTLDALTGVISAKDADKLVQVLADCKAKVLEFIKQNPELAKSYLAKVQNFLKENKDKISEFAAQSPSAQQALDALVSVDAESSLQNFISAIEGQAENVSDEAKAAAQEQLDNAKAAAQEQVDNAKAAAQEQADNAKAAAKEKANQAIDDAAAKAKKSLGL